MEIRVPNEANVLVQPGEVIDNNDPQLVAQLGLGPDKILLSGVPSYIRGIIEIPRVSEAIATPVGTLKTSSNPDFISCCQKLQQTINCHEFTIGLFRLAVHENRELVPQKENIDWLRTVKIKPYESVTCSFEIEFPSKEIMELGQASIEVVYDPKSGESGTFLTSEQPLNLIYIHFSNELKRILGEYLPINDTSPLVEIMKNDATEIQNTLDQLRVSPFDEKEVSDADEEPETDSNSFYDDEGEKDEAESEAEELNEGSDENDENELPDSENKASPSDGDNENSENGISDNQVESSETTEDLGDAHGSTADLDDRDSDSDKDDEEIASLIEDDSSTEGDDLTSGNPDVDEDESHESQERNGRNTGSRRGRMIPNRHSGERSRGKRSKRRAQKDFWISRPKTAEQVEQLKEEIDEGDDEVPENHSIGELAVGWVMQYERQQGRKPLSA